MSDNNSSSKTSAGATSMAELMQNMQSRPQAEGGFKKGEIVEGKITKLTQSEILVAVGGKAEALVFEKDKNILRSLLSSLHVGDKVEVSVLNPESDMGYPVVSLRAFAAKQTWGELDMLEKSKAPINVTIAESIRGGYLVQSDTGLSGFLPNSQIGFVQNPQEMVGKQVKVVVLEINRMQKKVIFSQKAAQDGTEFENSTKHIKEGQKIIVQITNVASFGMFAAIPSGDTNLDGFIHISEVSWEQVTSLSELFKVGQEIEVQVLGIDKENRRVNLSIKRLTDDPFTKLTKDLIVDQQLSGTVSKVIDGNVSINLGSAFKNAEGVIVKEKVPPTMTFEPGQKVTVTVSEIDTRKRRILLTPVLLRKSIGYR